MKEININLPKVLRAKQIAQNFGIGLSTVWLYAQQGKLTPISVSSKVTVFNTQEVLNLFSNDKVA
ncbi:DNA-binding protein [Aliarcobacter cryaerophilus]|jgi:predicted site-specific integrase-resolvase|uniref:DNA-binding protein n=1 Tax=Aliarcobacter cryaerophilus TaxID=28198 RepID=UPI0021B534B1|nr:DNA-binding protein [Aliarcobacter cryaerophilus]MCT7517364.1 DNA-binding protein [Aliarcobacter cryaerophilus]